MSSRFRITAVPLAERETGTPYRRLHEPSLAPGGRDLRSSAPSPRSALHDHGALCDLHPEVERGGLEQEFNSLDAQHEACAAYILSQASEGWSPSASYDDGGISAARSSALALSGCSPTSPPATSTSSSSTRSIGSRARSSTSPSWSRRSTKPAPLRLDHPVVQHHDQHGSADPQHAAVVRAVRARGHRRADPRQDRAVESQRHVDGWDAADRLSCPMAQPRHSRGGRAPSSVTSSAAMQNSAMSDACHGAGGSPASGHQRAKRDRS